MPGAARRADHTFAIQDSQQYKPATTLGDQSIRVPDSAGVGAGLLVCHASRRLDGPHHDADRLLVIVHGALRDSDRYLQHALAAAEPVGSRTLIVAPQFLADVDLRAHPEAPDGALYWDVEGWKGGETAAGPVALSSFAAMDSLLSQLTRLCRPVRGRQLAVIIVGNSAGGQFVNRYAAVGMPPDVQAADGIRVRFVIANPSTYLYFSPERPVLVPDGSRANRWRYGFDNAPSYVRISAQQSLERYLGRDVTIVLGAKDSDSAALLLEVSPPAMAQGRNRLDRGIRYHAHVRQIASAAGLAAGHQLIQLPGVGHAAGDVLITPQARNAMFG
jgi:hypothetical protein